MIALRAFALVRDAVEVVVATSAAGCHVALVQRTVVVAVVACRAAERQRPRVERTAVAAAIADQRVVMNSL